MGRIWKGYGKNMEMRNDFIDCMGELMVLGFDLDKNSACDLICSTMELMRYSGSTELDNVSIYEALWEKEEEK